MRTRIVNYARALMAIKWTEVHEFYALSSAHFDPTHLRRQRHLQKLKRVVSPTQIEIRGINEYIR